MPNGTPIADRLYGISLKPQELALYGDNLRISLSYAPMFDDEDAAVREHFKLLVLEGLVVFPEDPELGDLAGREIQVLKIGWELELETSDPVSPVDLEEGPEEVPRLISRIADTVNELARRAGLEAPFGPEVVDGLVARYRQGA
jgi:hypothetical protein